MNLSDARFPCEHERYKAHAVWQRGIVTSLRMDDCPGGSAVTAADLEGERLWWCEGHRERGDARFCIALLHPNFEPLEDGECHMVERLLIPIPDPVDAE